MTVRLINESYAELLEIAAYAENRTNQPDRSHRVGAYFLY